MCGIIGFNWSDKALIKSMSKKLSHRGPDAEGVYIDKTVSLGHRRLSILDLSKKGNQPMIYEHKNKKAVITYNGEIYNFQKIRAELEKKHYKFNSNTDTEVILAAYLEWGENCVNKFNGMWAFCIYDINKQLLFCSRDRIGIKPFYFYFDKNKFVFASEIKSLFLIPDFNKKLNLQVLNRFITMRYCFGQNTIFEEIKKLLPGNNLIYYLKSKKFEVKKYWNNKTNKMLINNEKLIHDKIISLLSDSIKKRLIADVPVGVFLSGGIDSSTIVALMRSLDKNTEIKTYSLAFEMGEQINELPWAKKISEKFNTTHKEFFIGPDTSKILSKLLWHLDEPMADPAIIPLYYLSKHSRKYVKTVLTGDGGDELFGGYDYYKIFNYSNQLSKIPFGDLLTKITLKITPYYFLNKIHKDSSEIRKDAIINRSYQLIKKLKKKDYFNAYNSLISIISNEERNKLLSKSFFQKLDSSEFNTCFKKPKLFLNKFLYYDQNILLPDSYLMKTDRMTMAVGLEARVPMLDYRLVEFSFNIPPKLKVKNGITKYVLRKTMNNKLPKNLLWREKYGFRVPIENWISENIKQHQEEITKNNEVKKIFNKRELNKIFNNYKKGELFYSRQVWNLICFNVWYKKVMC